MILISISDPSIARRLRLAFVERFLVPPFNVYSIGLAEIDTLHFRIPLKWRIAEDLVGKSLYLIMSKENVKRFKRFKGSIGLNGIKYWCPHVS